jgi:hypothetical protein
VFQAEHRALCVYVATHKLVVETRKDFMRFGGLRIVKRWLRSAEESDNVHEMIALVDLCHKLPFDEVAIRDVGIGKVIKKLLKFQSSSGGDVAALQSQVEKLIALWRAKQKEASAAGAAADDDASKTTPSLAPSELVAAISERLVTHRGPPQLTNDSQRALQAAFDRLDSTESKDDGGAHMPPRIAPPTHQVGKMSLANVFSAQNSAGRAEPLTLQPPRSAGLAGALTGAASAVGSIPGPAAGASIGAPNSVTPIKAPLAMRERKPLDMAEGARKLLAMRAQQAGTASSSGATSPGAAGGGAERSGGATLSSSASNVLNILSAVGKARTVGGLAASVHQVIIVFFIILFVFGCTSRIAVRRSLCYA